MATSIRFFGVAGYEIVSPLHRILIDPFLTGNRSAPVRPEDLERPDVILVSHAALDHLGDTAAIALRTGAPIVCGGDVRIKLIDDGVPGDQIQATVWGIVVEVAGVHVRPVECHHWSMSMLANGQAVSGNPLAFIIEPEPGVVIYHYGDTSYFDMAWIGELYRPTVGLIGCTVPAELAAVVPGPGRVLTGEMDAREAALAARALGVRLAVASHYTEPDREVESFLRLVAEGGRLAVAPRAGQTILVDGDVFSLDGAQI